MRNDKHGQIILTENDICDLFLSDPNRRFDHILTEEVITFSDELSLNHIPNCIKYTENNFDQDTFDSVLQSKWFIPEEYITLDIAKFVLDQCNTDDELQRAGAELLLFQERGMFMLLKYLKYLVDTLRTNNIIWGVGRGSSVASFVLFLIGVHRINSLYYDLSIEEFLK